MRPFVFLCFLCLSLAGVASLTWAFEPPESGMGQFQHGVQELKRTQLGPALGVDQRKVDQLLQIDQKYDPLKDQTRREARVALGQLQQLMRNPNPSEEEVRAVLETLLRKEQEINSLKQRQHQEEMAILTPIQQARYIMYLMGLRQQISREARSLRGGPRGTAPGPISPPGTTPREVVRPTP